MANHLPTKTKGRKAAKYRGAKCLNCGTPLDLSDVHCSYCGQLNTTKSLSLTDFLGEFLGSIITYDSKFRYTLKDLLFRPGVITRNFVKGQRLKYANPFRFFLSVSIIYFLLNGLIATITGENKVFNFNDNDQKEVSFGPTGDNVRVFSTPNDSIEVDSALTKEEEIFDSNAKKYGYPTKSELDSLIKTGIDKAKKKKEEGPSYKAISEDSLQTLSRGNRWASRLNLYYDFHNTTEIENPKQALDSLHHPINKWNIWGYKRAVTMKSVKDNPTEFLTYLVEKTPFFVFFFTPLYALFFWLIYSKKKYTYMEHMIFIFHLFSFIFLAMLIAIIPDTLLGTQIFNGLLFGLIGPFYYYKALRNFYQQNRLLTIIKFLFLNMVFLISASVSATIFFTISAAFY